MSHNTISDPDLLPVGLQDFSNIIGSHMLYVDKTELIFKIAKQRSPIFLSRPRRFGKSLLINTLSCLFEKGLTYFHDLNIEKHWQDKTYPVVHLDFSTIANRKYDKFGLGLCKSIIRQFNKYCEISLNNDLNDENPADILCDIAQDLGSNSVVLLIDEYDAPLVHHIENQDELLKIQSILHNFYAAIKQYTDKFRLIFITGITRASHVSIFSAFNNLIDISLNNEFNSLLGFTTRDLELYFDAYIDNVSNIFNISKDDVYKRLEQYYDGFQFSVDANQTLYNPWSILNFFKFSEHGFKNYWFESGGRSSLIIYLKIKDSFDFIDYKNRDITIYEEELSEIYEIDKISRQILLYQLGYFTIRNNEDGTVKLVVPNTEVENSLLRLYFTANNLNPKEELRTKLKKLAYFIDTKELKSIIKIFNDILNECVSSQSKLFEDERSVRDIIYTSLIMIPSIQQMKERDTAKGKSDLELITANTCMIIEFKRTYATRGPEASLQKAIEQVRKNCYGLIFSQTRPVYRAAMVISSEEKMILSNFSKEII